MIFNIHIKPLDTRDPIVQFTCIIGKKYLNYKLKIIEKYKKVNGALLRHSDVIISNLYMLYKDNNEYISLKNFCGIFSIFKFSYCIGTNFFLVFISVYFHGIFSRLPYSITCCKVLDITSFSHTLFLHMLTNNFLIIKRLYPKSSSSIRKCTACIEIGYLPR